MITLGTHLKPTLNLKKKYRGKKMGAFWKQAGKQTIHLFWSDFPKSKKNIVVSFSLKPVLDIETVG